MINQTIKYSIVISVILAALFGSFQMNANALALLAGTAWGCVNLYFISALSHSYLLTKNRLQTLLILLVKFPLLYWVGYELLRLDIWNPLALGAGFGILFVGMALSSYRQLPQRSV